MKNAFDEVHGFSRAVIAAEYVFEKAKRQLSVFCDPSHQTTKNLSEHCPDFDQAAISVVPAGLFVSQISTQDYVLG
jgi:hypothetical protein